MRKITNKNNSIPRVLTAIALVISLNACELTSVDQTQKGSAYDITAAAIQSSSYYMQKASTEPTAQADWYLLAAKAFIRENQLNEASNLVLTLSKMPLIDIQIAEWQLIRAEILILRNNAKAAAESLKFSTAWSLPQIQWRRYFMLQYTAFNKQNDKKNALIALINLESYSRPEEDQQLSDQTWSIVSRLTLSEQQALRTINNASLQAWLELLDGLNRAATYERKQQAIELWLSTYSNMLGARFLPDLLANLENLDIGKPSNIGVMLPLSKKFASQGETIRNGLVQALINDKTTDPKPTLNFYDTNKMSVQEIINDMKENSIQFVIGPLQKNKVQEFIKLSNGSFRHLAMNIPSGDFINSGSCFFTLSPEQEAEQAAIHIAKKHQNPVMIAPNNDLGKRVGRAFANQWQALTGRKVTVEYFANTSGMQRAVGRAMGVAQSQSRTNQLNDLLGLDMATEARSRRDVDAVYLFGGTGELNLLKPFVEVSVSPGDSIPKLYASSRSNNQPRGVPTVAEVNGIEFSDVPLLINSNSPEARKISTNWPDMSNSMVRLYSLGMDAYALINGIPQMQANPSQRLSGQSGRLYLNAPCTVNRQMSWARYTSSGIRAVE